MEALTAAALAQRFGGSRIAQLAAEKALLSRQASAEHSAASAAATHRDASEDGSKNTPLQPGELPANDDDEAFLLSGLLNRAGAAASGEEAVGRNRMPRALQRRPPELSEAEMKHVAVLSEEEEEQEGADAGGAAAAPHVTAASGSMRLRSDFGSPTEELLPAAAGEEEEEDGGAEGESSAYVEGAANAATAEVGRRPPAQAHEPPRRHSFASAAEEEDTVLTGSPVGGSPVAGSPAGGNPGDSPPACKRGGLGIKTIAAAEWLQAGAAHGQAAPAASSRGTPAPMQQLQTAAQAALQPPAATRAPKEAVRQRQWSFADIPQGTASIPSKAGSSGSGSAMVGRPGSGRAGAPPPKPAFYTRAPSPHLRASSAPPAAGKASSSAGGQVGGGRSSAAAAAQLRRQRLEQLAQPRHAGRQRPQHACGRQEAAAAGASAGAESGSSAGCPPPAGQPKVPLPSYSLPGAERIAAWGRKQAGLPKRLDQEQEQEQHTQTLKQPTKGSSNTRSSSSSSSGRHWPQSLGKRLDPAELQRATGAYSEDRFNCHLSQLRDTLALRQVQRQHAADATAAGVDELVTRVRQLGSGTGDGTGMHSLGCAYHEPAAVGASIDAGGVPAEQEPQQLHCRQPGSAAEERGPLAERGSPGQMEGGSCTLARSPTGKLVHCQEVLLQRPVTAPQRNSQPPPLSPRLLRPATGSPDRVKPLMQVKREQDRAIQQLGATQLGAAQQAFRASPLPLSTMEPRYHRELEQQEQRRQAVHEQRRQQLLEQQRPFGFDEREAERRERRLLLQASRQGMAAGAQVTVHVSAREAAGRPVTPSTFHAQPVPLSTSEARYALLVAEMQLQGRWVKGRGVSSPTGRRPATAAPCAAAERLCPATAPAAPAGWGGAGAARLERSQPVMMSACCSSSAGGAATWAGADAAAAAEGLAAEEAQAGPRGSTGWRPGAVGASSGATTAPGTCCTGGTMQPAEASGLHGAGGCCSDGAEAARHEDHSTQSMPPQLLPAPARSLAQPGAAATGPPSEELDPEADEGSQLQPVASSCSPALPALRKGNSSTAGPGAAVDEAAAVAAAAAAAEVEAPPLPPCQPSHTASPQYRASCGSSSSSWGHSEAAAAGPHKGSRAQAQLGRSAQLPEPGIAVPVCILPACRAAMAAEGGGVELLASAELPAAKDRCWPAQGIVEASPAAGQLRRDTPPQHIAARYLQAEAVARREVQLLLQKRGSSIVSLMQQSDGPV